MHAEQFAEPVAQVMEKPTVLAVVETRMNDLISQFSDLRSRETRNAEHAALYHLLSGGSRTRAKICLSASKSLGITESDAIALSACVELLHNASLIHDDLHDHEKFRHQTESVWKAYSPAIAICAGDLMISSAYLALASVQKAGALPALMGATHRCVAGAIRGQCADLESYARSALSFEDYIEIVKTKSGALLALPLELPLILSGNFHALEIALEAAADFSIGYQIMDDLVDFEQDSAKNDRTSRLNLYGLLRADFGENHAREKAATLGRTFFTTSASRFKELPKNSGHYLEELALKTAAGL